MPSSKHQTPSGSQIGFFSKFKVTKPSVKSNGRKRSRFDPQRRLEVKAVRGRRACLRCSLLRIKCSRDDICATCDNLAKHAYEKQTMSFSGCIRTRLDEVNIFDFFIPPSEVQDFFHEMSKDLASSIISLDFDAQMIWNLEHLVGDIANWFKAPSRSTTSKVGILSSLQFLQLLEPIFEEDLRISFQRMIYAISLAYTQPAQSTKHKFSIPELYQIGSLAGHRFLKALDDKLRVESLKRCSHDEIRALFLLVFGTILAIGYTDSPSEENIAYSSMDIHAPWREGHRDYSLSSSSHHSQFYRTRKFLGQVLAHYVIYLGAQLKLSSITQAEQSILTAASSLWNRRGAFIWKPTKREAARMHNTSHPKVSRDDSPIATGVTGLKSDTIGDDLKDSTVRTSAEYSRPTANLLHFEEILLPERGEPFMQLDQSPQVAEDKSQEEPMPSAFDPAILEDCHFPLLVEQDKIVEQSLADLFKSFNSPTPVASLTTKASLDDSIPSGSTTYWCQICEKSLSEPTKYCSNACYSAALDPKPSRFTTSHSPISQVAEWSATISPVPKILRDQASITRGFDWSSHFYHSQLGQAEDQVEFRCTVCMRACRTRGALARHMKSHGSKGPMCTFTGCTAVLPRHGDFLRQERCCHVPQPKNGPGADDAGFDLRTPCSAIIDVNPELLILPEESADSRNLVKRSFDRSLCQRLSASSSRLDESIAELIKECYEEGDWIATVGQHLLI